MRADIIHAIVLWLAFIGCISIVHITHGLVLLPYIFEHLIEAVVACLVFTPIVLQYFEWSEIVTHARYDSLTGLLNRNSFDKKFKKFIKKEQKFQVVLMDLCKFKSINDTYGHRMGDEVLKIIAKRFRHSLRPADIAARLGGDEFVALIDGELSDIEYIDLIKHVEESMQIDGINLNVGVSIGVTTYPIHGEDYSTLMSQADCAMYYAKKSGISIFNGIPEKEVYSADT